MREWWRSIKKFVDTNPKLHFVLSGSNTFDLQKGMDLMPGHWSNAGEVNLYPMLFEEWCQMRQQALWPTKSKKELLEDYFRIGGFPSALTEAGPDSVDPIKSRETFQKWLRGDVIKLQRQESFMRELMGQVVNTMGSSLSLQKLAQATNMMSYHTAQDYIQILESSFALKTLYAYDPEKDSFHYKKTKEILFL